MAPTFAGVVPSDHCDADGHLTSRGLMACFSNAAPHFWTAVGLPFREIRRRQQGTVALEDLLTYGRPIRAGETLQIRSAVRAVGRKTVGFSHFVFESGSGELVARGDVTAGIMDLTARSLVELGGELGDDLTAKLRDRLIDI